MDRRNTGISFGSMRVEHALFDAHSRVVVAGLFVITISLLPLFGVRFYGCSYVTGLLLVISVFLASVPMAHGYVRRGSINLFSPVNLFLALFTLFWICRSFYIAAKGYRLFATGGPPLCYADSFDWGLMLSVAGLLAFLLCYYFSGLTPVARHSACFFPKFIDLSRRSNVRQVKRYAYLFFAVILGLYWIFMRSSGGILHFIFHWNVLRFSVGSGKTIAFCTFYMMQPVVWIIFVCFLAERRAGRARKTALWGFVFCLVVATFVIFSLGSRGGVLLLWGGLVLIYHYVEKPITLRRVFFLFLMFFAFGVLIRGFRSFLGRGNWFGGFEDFNFLTFLDIILRDFTSVDLSYFYMANVPEGHDFISGASITDIPSFIIPRAIWLSKPTALGPAVLLPHFFPGFLSVSHISPSLIGELYINFSYMGIILGMSTLGLFYQAITRYLSVSRGEHIEKSVMLAFSLAVAFCLLKLGVFGGLVRLIVVYLFPILLLLFVSRTRFSFNFKGHRQKGQRVKK